jgi:hypothetical protein
LTGRQEEDEVNFTWIAEKPFPAERRYFFTATPHHTDSERSVGMNNEEYFGKVLYNESPAALIDKGEMVRTRMHLVDFEDGRHGDYADGYAIVDAFIQHASMTNVGAKMLVVAKDGSDHLDMIAGHEDIMRLQSIRPKLRIFDISSKFGGRVNGEEVGREVFLETLRSLQDEDEAIIIHHSILTEGIDVPGITGVMPLINMKKSKFCQTNGRATRLHPNDRAKLYGGMITPEQLDWMIKPNSWLIIPVYADDAEEKAINMIDMIYNLRSHGFDPHQDIFVKPRHGAKGNLIESVDYTNTKDTRFDGFMKEKVGKLIHTFESKENARILYEEVQNFKAVSASASIDEIKTMLEF